MLFLNYPFIKMGLPFWFGFLLYGLVGFWSIILYIKWIHLVLGKQLLIRGINILPIFYFLPNLHYWTAGLGKEPLIFFGLVSVFYAMASRAYITFSSLMGGILLLILRPHVAMMLLSALVLVFVFNEEYSLKRRVAVASVALSFFLTLLYMVFQITHIRHWNWERILYFNAYSIESFRHSGSYVPMLEYSLPYQLFSFYFRPLFFDANSLFQHLASVENVFVFAIHLLGILFALRDYKKIHYPQWVKMVFLFTLICGLLYVQRYANLGIFMRTKMMFQPFTLIALLFIIKQGKPFKNT
ncbi:hypothetical protein DB895_13025 [Flavobacterium psychrotolerans]|uniref:O-antigen ligase domain-containing protein n=2 Tax=Flavobacterium psychrotolerans TaxID=2169410 RepID=A0A2U1JGA9_9FLAO|nr:hypothetical protein DB895_13025 [Flavobacterium psychrotolerans]